MTVHTPLPAPQGAMQRATGAVRLHLGLRRGRVAPIDMAQRGSAKVMLPRANPQHPEAVFLNTAGGLTSGDDLSFHIRLGPQASATAATQTAERAYLALQGPARMQIGATLDPGAQLLWLPQETILFEGCNLVRDTRINLGTGATCLMVETIVLGRRAMGEHPKAARLRDSRQVCINGQPVWTECFTLDESILSQAHNPATFGSDIAFSTIALVGPGAEDATPAVRALPTIDGVQVAASGWNGRCLVRLMAPDLWPLKRQLVRILASLSPHPLPRCWQMHGATP